MVEKKTIKQAVKKLEFYITILNKALKEADPKRVREIKKIKKEIEDIKDIIWRLKNE